MYKKSNHWIPLRFLSQQVPRIQFRSYEIRLWTKMSHPFYTGNFARRRGSRTCTLPPSRRTCRARRGTSSTWATTRSHWRPRSHENHVINEGNYCINIKFAVVFVKNNTRWADITKKESTFAQPWSLSWLIYEESELIGKACFLPSLRHVTQVLKMSVTPLTLISVIRQD